MHKIITKGEWNLTISGSSEVYIHHTTASGERRFVARLKHARPGTNAKAFAKFLVAHFTPAEYFAAYEAGHAPAQILCARGYVSPNQRAAAAVRLNAQFSTAI